MSGRKYPTTPDANEKEIVDALRAHILDPDDHTVRIKVHRIEGRSGSAGVLDLLCEVPADETVIQLLEAIATMAVDSDSYEHIQLTTDDLQKRLSQPHWVLLEVKNPESAAGVKNTIKAKLLDPCGEYEDVLKYCTRKIARLCKRTQGDFLLAHDAPMHVVTTVEEALAACGVES